jgi:hypothetical protein
MKKQRSPMTHSRNLNSVYIGMLRIHDILVWIRIRIRGSRPLTNGSGSGSWIRILLFSSLAFKMLKQKTNLQKSYSTYYFWNEHLHHFSKIKSQKEVTKQLDSRFFQGFLYYFWMMIEGSGSRRPDPHTHTDPDPDSDPDPQHWYIDTAVPLLKPVTP